MGNSKEGGSRAGETRPSLPPRGFRDRVELATASVPWSAKLVIAYAVIAAALAASFSLINFDVEWMRDRAWNIVRLGLPLTLLICAGAITLATVLATLGALARLSRNPFAYAIAGFYTSFFRGTPLIVQIFIIYFALAEVGIRLRDVGYEWLSAVFILDVVPAGIVALGLNYGAYMTEIFRAGIQSVGHGQGEAADALGMTYRQKMRRIVLPQALRVIIPPTGNEFIAMLKDSALVSTIGALELFRRAELAGRTDFRTFEAFIVAAVAYWIVTGIFSFFQARLERRLGRGYVRADTRQRGQPKPRPPAAAQPGLIQPPIVESSDEHVPTRGRGPLA